MQCLLGIDVGTTGTKTLLLRRDGKLLGQSYCPYETRTPGVGISEQTPNDWWNAVVQTVRQVLENQKDISIQLSFVQLTCQFQKHGGVSVMTTGVHGTRVGGREG